MAASNNTDHAPQSLYYCLFAPHICGVVVRAHPVRGESHIQRNANGEVATLLPKLRSETGSGFSNIFDSGSISGCERQTQNSAGVDSGTPDPW